MQEVIEFVSRRRRSRAFHHRQELPQGHARGVPGDLRQRQWRRSGHRDSSASAAHRRNSSAVGTERSARQGVSPPGAF